MDNKEIAKEIVIAMIEKGIINYEGFTTTTDAVCEAFKKVYHAVLKGENV